jgi:simple sugar transport system permease protein
VIGAIVIKSLDTTIYTIGITPETTLLFKAIVVIVLCLAQSPAFRTRVFNRRHRPEPPAPTAPAPKLEVPA